MSRVKGVRGENLAKKYYMSLGYRIVAQNFHARRGEIDLIAEVFDENLLSVCEVKYWDAVPFEEMAYSLDKKKQTRIIHAAEIFLQQNPVYYSYQLRFDLLFITEGGSKIQMVKDAF